MIQGSDCGALRIQRARLMEENDRLLLANRALRAKVLSWADALEDKMWDDPRNIQDIATAMRKEALK